MATAMAFPNQESKGRGKKSILNIDFSRDYLVKARYVLRNNPPASNSAFPQYALDVMSGLMTLTEAYVLSANVHRRHLTKGQQAMAVALAYPEPDKRGRGNKLNSLKIKEFEGINSGYISQARFVLRHCLEKAEEVLSNPHYPLTKAYEDVQAIVEQQRKDEEERKERERQLEELRAEFPDLAALFDDKRLGLRDALSAAQNRRDEAAEKARIEAEEAERIRREEEAKLAEADPHRSRYSSRIE